MATSYGALCTDFYINLKLAVKMDLPYERETVLHFFDRLRKSLPAMNRFRRYDGELALESSRRNSQYTWLALRQNSIRSGNVNPETLEAAMEYHRLILEQAPYHLTISPLDVDFVELLLGFDLECRRDHDEVVSEALLQGTAMGSLLDVEGVKPLDVQPMVGMTLSDAGDLQAFVEVKTRTKSRRGSGRRYAGEPISVFLTLRQYGPVDDLTAMNTTLLSLMERADQMATDLVVPQVLNPIARLVNNSSR